MMWLMALFLIIKQPVQAESVNLLNLSWSTDSQISNSYSPLLGDLFYISSTDSELDKNLRLEPLPSQWRESLKINRAQAIEWFRQYIQHRKMDTKVRLSISMPEQVDISKNNSVSNTYLRNLALAKIKTACSSCELHLLEAKTSANFNSRPTQAVWTGIDQQQISFVNAQDPQSSNSIFDIWVADYVWVTQAPLLNGEKLSQDNLKSQSLVMKWSQAQMALKSSVLPEQYMAVKAINGQSTIKISEVKKNRVVKIGQPMRGVFKGDQFSIEMAVVARESGAIGDQIKVYKSDTRKELMAKVITDDQVEIMP